jgi:hypothetical protein
MCDDYVCIYVITPRKIILIRTNKYNSKERHSSSKIGILTFLAAVRISEWYAFVEILSKKIRSYKSAMRLRLL